MDQQSVLPYRYRRAQPILQPLRRLPQAKQADAGEMLEDMQESGVIEESDSPWSSPILVWKKNRDLCFCVDYGKLYSVTMKGCFPLPQIDVTLNMLAGAKWFSALTLKSGYWQVDIHPDDKEKTAFSVCQGLWLFTVKPCAL
jgi:hypothetical protein